MTLKINRLESIYSCIGAHPFIVSFLICLLLTPFCFGAESNITGSSVLFTSLLIAVIVLYSVYRLHSSERLNKPASVLLAAGLILSDIILTAYFGSTQAKAFWIFIAGAALLILFKMFVQVSEKGIEKLTCFYIISGSFLIKLFYVLTTSCYTRQNDVHKFGGSIGHAAYIEYLLNNRRLPDFDVREVWQFYHPPLHHAISAGWINFLESCGVDHNFARESLQMLTLFYSTACVIVVYKILRHFNFKGAALYIPLAVFAFHPSYILMSGSINNDMLSVLFILSAVLNTLKWRENPTLPNILKIAVSIGLGMMTKLSAGLVAPAVAFVFAAALFSGRKKIRSLICQYAAFGAVCCPLGLWWGIRNYIKFKVPITYVPGLDLNSSQYIGEIPFLKRITDFSSAQFESVFEQWESRGSYNEYNPTVAILKNSLFGESINESNFAGEILFIPKIFFWVGTALAVISVLLMIIYTIRKSTVLKWDIKAFFWIFYIVMMVNFYSFCYKFPHTCTQNFRYIIPTVMIGCVFIGTMLNDGLENCRQKSLTLTSKCITIISAAFVILSFFTYFFLCANVN
ncbi:glycosyltransferase family 39 protein [Ruminococcus sp. Marseille-P6503]|uniref:glycosyltransferase family 39 protein n=1 Tax=Ruminococcus sp. Marseille-P6503 TaxID=2364796 RepID=UPI0013DDFB59|nr:glycosyltransferase family 39 protein [Ruminococcus sp. Marseille-P6503]